MNGVSANVSRDNGLSSCSYPQTAHAFFKDNGERSASSEGAASHT